MNFFENLIQAKHENIRLFAWKKYVAHFFIKLNPGGGGGGHSVQNQQKKVQNTPTVIKTIKKLAQAILCTNLDISCNCQQLKVFKIVQY